MSRNHIEREQDWANWRQHHATEGLAIVGFEHWCGQATLISDTDDADLMCAGCRSTCADPLRECQPLYRPFEWVDITDRVVGEVTITPGSPAGSG